MESPGGGTKNLGVEVGAGIIWAGLKVLSVGALAWHV